MVSFTGCLLLSTQLACSVMSLQVASAGPRPSRIASRALRATAGGGIVAPSDVTPNDIVFMMNGLPGKMGLSVAAACVARGMAVADVALTGPKTVGTVEVSGKTVRLLAAGSAEANAAVAELVVECASAGKTLIAIDYTSPSAALPNAEFYARHSISFVMGTTGADSAALARSVEEGSHCAVIAPNMSKQIVALQAALASAAAEFPGAFGGYALDVVESHQSAKVDTSGTAKAVVASLVSLVDATATDAKVADAIEAIERVRDEPTQLDGANTRLQRVSSDALAGHAYHTYALTSADNSVRFELRHNVNGRATYAEGTADAVVFLANKRLDSSSRRLFDMIDILKSGDMS